MSTDNVTPIRAGVQPAAPRKRPSKRGPQAPRPKPWQTMLSDRAEIQRGRIFQVESMCSLVRHLVKDAADDEGLSVHLSWDAYSVMDQVCELLNDIATQFDPAIFLEPEFSTTEHAKQLAALAREAVKETQS